MRCFWKSNNNNDELGAKVTKETSNDKNGKKEIDTDDEASDDLNGNESDSESTKVQSEVAELNLCKWLVKETENDVKVLVNEYIGASDKKSPHKIGAECSSDEFNSDDSKSINNNNNGIEACVSSKTKHYSEEMLSIDTEALSKEFFKRLGDSTAVVEFLFLVLISFLRVTFWSIPFVFKNTFFVACIVLFLCFFFVAFLVLLFACVF